VQKVGMGMDGPSKASYGYTGNGSGFTRHYKALTTLTTFGTFADANAITTTASSSSSFSTSSLIQHQQPTTPILMTMFPLEPLKLSTLPLAIASILRLLTRRAMLTVPPKATAATY
jgi:hypothetical protein